MEQGHPRVQRNGARGRLHRSGGHRQRAASAPLRMGPASLGPPPPGVRARFAIRGSPPAPGKQGSAAPGPSPPLRPSPPACSRPRFPSRRPSCAARGTPPHARAQSSTRTRPRPCASRAPLAPLLRRSTVPFCSRAPARVARVSGCAHPHTCAYVRGTAEQTPPLSGGRPCSGDVPSFRLSRPP